MAVEAPVAPVSQAAAAAERQKKTQAAIAQRESATPILDPVEFATRFYVTNPMLAQTLAANGEKYPEKACAEACHRLYTAYLLTISVKFRDHYIATTPRRDGIGTGNIPAAYVPDPTAMQTAYDIARAA